MGLLSGTMKLIGIRRPQSKPINGCNGAKCHRSQSLVTIIGTKGTIKCNLIGIDGNPFTKIYIQYTSV